MSQLEQDASRMALAQTGFYGSKILTPIVNNRIVASTNMKNGAYTIANQPVTPAILSVLATAVAGADTMGTITIVGTDINGSALTEVVTPIAGTTVYTTKEFKTVTSVTGADWVAVSTADTIIVGTAGIVAPTGFYFATLFVMSASVVASMTHVPGTIQAPLNSLTTIPAGAYPLKATAIALTSGQAIAVMVSDLT